MHGTPLFFPLHTAHHHLIAPTAQCGKTALIIGLRQRRDAGKTAEERFNMLARGWLAYPVTSMHAHLPPKSGCRNVIPRLANNLYNRSSAVDSLIHNQPQVGKPTWGYNYTTALRRLPLPSAVIPKNRPSSSDCANGAMRKKTAEERFHTLARGWLAYPVTSIHSHLPPKSGCRNPIPRFAILVLFDYFRNKMFYELHRCIIPHRFFDKRPRSHSRQRASR